MKAYVFECFILHGSGEIASVESWNRREENDFVSIHEDFFQPNVSFSLKYDDDGCVVKGFYEVKVFRALSLKDALRQIRIALCASFAKAYFLPRYRCLSSNDLDCRTSIRYINRPVEDYFLT